MTIFRAHKIGEWARSFAIQNCVRYFVQTSGSFLHSTGIWMIGSFLFFFYFVPSTKPREILTAMGGDESKIHKFKEQKGRKSGRDVPSLKQKGLSLSSGVYNDRRESKKKITRRRRSWQMPSTLPNRRSLKKRKRQRINSRRAGNNGWLAPRKERRRGKKITNFFFLVVSTKVAGDILCIEFYLIFG